MPAELQLRSFQPFAVQRLREGFAAGHKRQMLMSPTGSGKSCIATHLLSEVQRKNTRAAFIVDRISLSDQFSAMLDHYGVNHGVLQSSHWRNRPWERIFVATAQTLERRGFVEGLELLILDEAHCTRKHTLEFIEANPDLAVIGLSATPFTKGLGKVFSNLVCPITTDELIAQNLLVPLKMYAAKAIDMTGAKVVAGEWSVEEIEQRGTQIIGDIVAEWQDKTQKHFGGPVKTLVYAATVPHGDELCRQFQAAGFNFQQISYRDADDASRREKIADFRKPDAQIIGLISCEVLVKGADFPDVQCLVIARPYRKSVASHIQMLGRGMRIHLSKEFCLVLDHAGNCIRFKKQTDEIFAHGIEALDTGDKPEPVPKEPTKDEIADVKCACGFILAPSDKACPACGKPIIRRSLVTAIPGKLVELNPQQKMLEAVGGNALVEVWKQLCALAMERKHGDVEAAKRFALAQYREMFKEWPTEPFSAVRVEIPVRLRARVIANVIRFAKRRGAQNGNKARTTGGSNL